MKTVTRHMLSAPKGLGIVTALALIWTIGLLDYFTGKDFVMSPFYLVPICWAAWVNGRFVGYLLATNGAATWFIADLMSGTIYENPLVGYWNTLMLFIFFLVVVYLLTAFQASQFSLEETLEQRTHALRALEIEVQERKRLEAAKLQAERLAVAGQMAAQVAHEVRNPLGSITLNLDLIHKEIGYLATGKAHSPDEGRLLIKDVREEVCRIGRVIEEYASICPAAQAAPHAGGLECVSGAEAGVSLFRPGAGEGGATHGFRFGADHDQCRGGSIVAGGSESYPKQLRSDARRRRVDDWHAMRGRAGRAVYS